MHLKVSSATWWLICPSRKVLKSRHLQSLTPRRYIHKSPCPLQWRQNGHNSVSTHQPHDCLLNRLFRRRSKKTSKLRVTGLCAGTGEFSAQMASNAENVFIWWRHHATPRLYGSLFGPETKKTLHLWPYLWGKHRHPMDLLINSNARSVFISWCHPILLVALWG